ncbi:metallophosphoesterase [Thiofilum flexile]|uniref:metallophosphoesterase n=1 Tax=Thiofilum flexile TaxID=125627 RepID=UPI00036B79BC|nr:metallophosphoesterase [Thiofilum flexile]
MTETPLVQLLQITDTHCYASDSSRLEWTTEPLLPNLQLQQVLQYLSSHYRDYNALLVTGDLAQQEVPETYQRLNQRLKAFPIPVHVIPGNHDTVSLAHTYLEERFWAPSFMQYGAWHILMLDTSRANKPDGHLSSEQYQKLAEYLAQIPEDEFAVIVMHHHPMIIHSAWMDGMGLQNAAYFWQWVEQYPCIQAILHGHIHQEFNAHYHYPSGRGVAVYGTPSTSVQLKPLTPNIVIDHSNPAWRTLQLHPNGSISTRVHYLPI